MLENVLLLAFCLLVGLLSLAVCIWVIVTGRIFYLDGLLLVLVSLTLGGFFMFNIFWSIHTGEMRAVLNYLRRRVGKSNASSEPPPAST